MKYITKLEQINELSDKEKCDLQKVCDKFAFRANEYYLSLINWDDPNDPIRRIVIPDIDELNIAGQLDASNEKLYTKVHGLEHKYEHIAVLLVNNTCGCFCRFCFRKRLFMNENDEIERDISDALDYIDEHKELNNILLSGGDPLLLSTSRLEKIISQLRNIDHIKIIRIGTKIPAFNPYRILDDKSLLNMLEKYSTPDKKIYLMVHFNHPNELTEPAIKALHLLHKSGVVICNQTPLIRGVNDSPEVLAELLNKLAYIGVSPYYIFQCRPTLGNGHLAIPLEKAFEIHEQAKMKCSGLSKRSRLSMSHVSGKIEVLGLTEKCILFKFHRSANPEHKARIIICKRNPNAYWYDDYTDVIDDYIPDNPFYQDEFEPEYALFDD